MYVHTEIRGLAASFTSDSYVRVVRREDIDPKESLEAALETISLAARLGAVPPRPITTNRLPYDDGTDNVTFDAPLLSLLAGRRMRFLRGWKQYDGCVKGLNAIGLLADHTMKEQRRLETLTPDEIAAERRAFLRTRKRVSADGGLVAVFTAEEVERMPAATLAGLPLRDVAFWKAFADRPIICSTSTNMGITLHQALRNAQRVPAAFQDRPYTLLNIDEGWLVIWCPDERADFMTLEKIEYLEKLETEQPPLTALHTYINRKERDPGALRDALVDGGYFFPTNPQSEEEMQNLFFMALDNIAQERQATIRQVLEDPKVLQTLESLDCVVEDGRVLVRKGVVAGLYGLSAAYYLMFEEVLQLFEPRGVAVWNQASIGAALAALVLGDTCLAGFERLPAPLKQRMSEVLPETAGCLRHRRLGRDIQTRIHGVFDIANLQSLAQLLGVVVERHLSGRKTALVGLGSSSYATGNKCYDVLKNSRDNDGAFKGRSTFHAATQTLVPISQALIFAEDMFRVVTCPAFESLPEERRLPFAVQHVVKAEPAGAAGVAGYLLARLDSGTLSLIEIAFVLRSAGFDGQRLLWFCNYGHGQDAQNRFLQEAFEEGEFMGHLARNLLTVLDWDVDQLARSAALERAHSRLNYRLRPLDDEAFEALDPLVHINLTGDNCRQPAEDLVGSLMLEALRGRDALRAAVAADEELRAAAGRNGHISRINTLIGLFESGFDNASRWVGGRRRNLVQRLISRQVRRQSGS